MQKLFFFLFCINLLFFTILSCKDDESDTNEPCIGEKNILISCITVYDPVCGCDGKEYSNACIAQAEGILSWQAGNCN